MVASASRPSTNRRNNPPVLELTNVSRTFDRTLALDDVSLQISRGEVFGLVGENGAGKTTLIRHSLGLLKPQTGAVRVFGLDPVSNPVDVLSRIGYLEENREMPDWMTLNELCRYLSAFYPTWAHDYAEDLQETFDINPRVQIGRLSQGQRARAGLVVALAHKPDLLILDEPSSGLDPVVRRDIVSAIVRSIAEEGRTVLFSSHLLDEVESVATSIAIIRSGRISFEGRLEHIMATHQRFKIRLPQHQASPPQIPGALECSGAGRDWSVIWNGEAGSENAVVARCGATIVERKSISLEDIFVARSRAPRLPYDV